VQLPDLILQVLLIGHLCNCLGVLFLPEGFAPSGGAAGGGSGGGGMGVDDDDCPVPTNLRGNGGGTCGGMASWTNMYG
jgi:hypothetical protein